ncbi:hypothetical protein [Roseateles albus]|uniref:Uncharacterized protein n=1 Tax=Roseateles albus TaxID=2987525 RepID=A0ABT5KI76_9BURK|nr:hypothetical protein [Roseateles albus]MDC8773571.1 hypothetical protein [Roseateles albus]
MERDAITKNLKRIETSCGLDIFFWALIRELGTGDTLAQIRPRLPYDLSVPKLSELVKSFLPEFAPLLEKPKSERLADMQALYVKNIAATERFNIECELVCSAYDANHSVYKYFTQDWFKKFNAQKGQATSRNIEWKFDFLTWILWWIQTGKIDSRGRGREQYQMCRNNDTGPYSSENCYCATGEENRADAREWSRSAIPLRLLFQLSLDEPLT